MNWFAVICVMSWRLFVGAIDDSSPRTLACNLIKSPLYSYINFDLFRLNNRKFSDIVRLGLEECDELEPDQMKLNSYVNFLRNSVYCTSTFALGTWLLSLEVLWREHFTEAEIFSYPWKNDDWQHWRKLVNPYLNRMSLSATEWAFKLGELEKPPWHPLEDQQHLRRIFEMLSWLPIRMKYPKPTNGDCAHHGHENFTRMEAILATVGSLSFSYSKENCPVTWNPIDSLRGTDSARYKFQAQRNLIVGGKILLMMSRNFDVSANFDDQHKPQFRYQKTIPFKFVDHSVNVTWLWGGVKMSVKTVYDQLGYDIGERDTLEQYSTFKSLTIAATFYSHLYRYLRVYIDHMMTADSDRFGLTADSDPKYLAHVRGWIAKIPKSDKKEVLAVSLEQIRERIETPIASYTMTAVDLALMAKIQMTAYDYLIEIETTYTIENVLISNLYYALMLEHFRFSMDDYVKLITTFE